MIAQLIDITAEVIPEVKGREIEPATTTPPARAALEQMIPTAIDPNYAERAHVGRPRSGQRAVDTPDNL